MNKLKSGDKSKSICHDCKRLVSITFRFRNIPFSDGSGMVESILAGVCDHCDKVISIPHQSTPSIKNAYNKLKEKK